LKNKEEQLVIKDNKISELISKINILVKQQKEDSKIIHENYSQTAKKISSFKENQQKTVSEKNLIIENLTRKIKSLTKEINTIKNNLNDVQNKEYLVVKKEDKLKQVILEKDQIISRLETDLLKFKSLLDKNFDKESDLKGKLYSKDKEIKNQSYKLKQIHDKEFLIQNDLKKLTGKFQDLNKKLYLSENEIKFKNKAISKVIDEIRKLESLNKNKTLALENLKKFNIQLQEKNNNLQIKNNNLQEHFKRKEKHIIEIENEIGVKRIKLESTKKAMSKLLEENNFLRNTLKENTQKMSKENIVLDKEFSKYKKENLEKTKKLKEDYENKINSLIAQNTDSEISLKLRIENLNQIISEQNKLIEQKREKEKQIAIDFTAKIKEALMIGSGTLKDLKEVNLEEVFKDYKEEEVKNISELNIEKENFKKKLGLEEKTQNHLIPLVQLAINHGEKTEKIIKTLSNSGYKVEDVKEALNKVLKKN